MKTGMKKKTMITVGLAVGLGILAGCGGYPGLEDLGLENLRLKTLHGRITEVPESVDVQGELRVALLWFLLDDDGSFNWVAEDVEVDDLSQFELGIVLPPPDALNWLDAVDPELERTGWIAEGIVIVYDDRNGNARLDLLEEDATGTVDAIVGPNPMVVVIFLDIAEGYQANSTILQLDETGGGEFQTYQMGEEIPIRLTDAPKLQWLMCSEFPVCRDESESPDLVCRIDCGD